MGMLDFFLQLFGLKSAPGTNPDGTPHQAGILEAVFSMIQGHGGMENVLNDLKQKGLGEQVKSWVGSGPNMPVTADQLRSALGQEKIDSLAKQTGLPVGDLLGQLSTMLPHVVDKLTPNGQVPDHGLLQSGMAMLRQLLGSGQSLTGSAAAPVSTRQ